MGNKLFPKVIGAVSKVVKDEPDILAVYLLGSALQGSLRPDSDIDLGIMPEPGRNISAFTKIKLAGILSYELGRTVDLGEISTKNLVYSREALLKGKPVYIKDEDKVKLYRANLLGMYIQFNLDRKEVVNAYTSG